MGLRMLPDLVAPITNRQINALMDNIMQLNTVDAGIHERYQRALTINFHIYDLFVKSHGKWDYRGLDGLNRLTQDAMSFIGGSTIASKHGDLPAAHLAIDYHDTQSRLAGAGMATLSHEVNDLLLMSRSLADLPPQTEQRIALLLDYLSKRPA